MVTASEPLTYYVLSTEAIRRAIGKLEENPIHEHFAGYLALLRAKRSRKDPLPRMADITEFHERYLRVIDGPDRAPYVRPFRSRGKGIEKFNANVAGSYAPSSLRSKGKLVEILSISTSGQTALYDLKENHANLALESLLKGKKAPAASLAAFLYRDYGFSMEQPSMPSIMNIFRDEFGLREALTKEKAIFNTLFVDDSPDYKKSDLKTVILRTA